MSMVSLACVVGPIILVLLGLGLVLFLQGEEGWFTSPLVGRVVGGLLLLLGVLMLCSVIALVLVLFLGIRV